MSDKPELGHVGLARKYIGVKEIKGTKHEAKIIDLIKAAVATNPKDDLSWLFGKDSKGKPKYNDEVAWCGSFLGGIFAKSGLGKKIPKAFYQARAWENVGTKLDKPAYGCVVTFTRNGGGHVGLVIGKTEAGFLKVLGGNQSDGVNIADFDPKRVTAYRWLSSGTVPNEHRYDLPILPAGRVSINEA